MGFDWFDSRKRRRRRAKDGGPPALRFVLAGEGKILRNDELRKYSGPAIAVFDRPPNRAHGGVFLADGATFSEGIPWQDGGQAMAFTFCTEEEFPAFLKAWRSRGNDGTVRSREQGEARRQTETHVKQKK